MLLKTILAASLAFGVSSTALSAAPTSAHEPVSAGQEEPKKKKRKSRKVPSMTLSVNKKVAKAQEFMELTQFTEALEILNDLRESTKINDYERAIVWQLLATISYEQGDTPGTIRGYEEVLKLRESIPEAQEVALIFNLSQLYYSQEEYETAIDYYNQWESKSEVIGIKQIYYGAQLNYVAENYEEAIRYARKAIAEAETVDTIEPEENWYALILSAYWELNDYPNVAATLETLIINWPSPQYWRQLAGTYQELGKEQAGYSITEAAYKQGFFDDQPNVLENVAQILIAREAPIKGAWVLEDALSAKLVEKTAKNQRTLASAYARASEYAKAVGPMAIAAAGDEDLDPDGTMWLQVATFYSQLDRLDEAVEAYEKAIELFKKEKTKKAKSNMTTAYMSRGTALIELKKFDAARKSFDEARKLGAKKSTLKTWMNYLASEKSREDILASAGR